MKKNVQFLITSSIRAAFMCLFFFSLQSDSIWAQCGAGQAYVQIQTLEDASADAETSWVLKDQNNLTLASGTPEGQNICVPAASCLTFGITDSGNDGLYDGVTTGYVIVRYNGNIVGQAIGNFGNYYGLSFGNCPAGIACSVPITAVSDASYTASEPDTWYSFTPDTTGLFQISTCNTNTCNTTLWVYDYCANLLWNDTQQGAIAYNDDFCGQQAQISIDLQKNQTYYIRVGDNGTSCENTPIEWQLTFVGPITGCMDINACNYNPLATVAGSCIYAPNVNCPGGPDLAVLESDLQSSIYLDQINVNSPCTVNEGCSTGYNNREVIRFTTHIQNIGTQDYFIGAPNTTSGQFEWDNCHNHWHYEGYAEYLLYDQNANEIPIGFKNGFCVLDLECYNGGVAKYSCGNMGISVGCGDIYDSYLDCQWIDITNVAAGIYTLVVRVNWDQSPDVLGHYETNYANNWAQACIEIVRNGIGNTQVNLLPTACSPYVDCLGQIYGNAQIDCNGNCNGNALAGDLDQNVQYTNNDLASYLSGIAHTTLNATNCNDLNTDDSLTVTDAVLLQACMLQQSGSINPGSNNYCQLPTFNVTNPNDTAWFSLANYNAANQTIDVLLKSPAVFVHSFQFQFVGAELASVVSLLPLAQYDANLNFNYADGKTVVFSNSGNSYPKYVTPTPVLRLYLTGVAGNTSFCMENFTVVNNYFQEVVPIETPACLQPYLNAQLQVVLQGAYNPISGYMRTTLWSESLLPANQPFNRTPWNYAGSEYVALNNMPTNVCDWLLLELQDLGGQIISRRAALLLSNGMLQDVSGNSGVNFPGAQAGITYKIVVRSRHHLPVISANAMLLPIITPYSFAIPANVEGGIDQLRNVASTGTTPIYALIAGDFNANGVITVSDYNKFSTQLNSGQTINLYNDSDVTLDGNVLVNDFNAYYSNFSAIGVPAVRY